MAALVCAGMSYLFDLANAETLAMLMGVVAGVLVVAGFVHIVTGPFNPPE